MRIPGTVIVKLVFINRSSSWYSRREGAGVLQAARGGHPHGYQQVRKDTLQACDEFADAGKAKGVAFVSVPLEWDGAVPFEEEELKQQLRTAVRRWRGAEAAAHRPLHHHHHHQALPPRHLLPRNLRTRRHHHRAHPQATVVAAAHRPRPRRAARHPRHPRRVHARRRIRANREASPAHRPIVVEQPACMHQANHALRAATSVLAAI